MFGGVTKSDGLSNTVERAATRQSNLELAGNEIMLRVGISGIGFMGMIHYLSYRKVDGVEVAAIASRDERKRAGDWRGIKGNFGPVGEQMDLGDIKTYERFEDLIADPHIDLVDITTPPYQHAAAAIAALQAGKHVFCEKPLTLDAESSAQVVATAKECGRLLLVGHVLPFFPEYRWARSVIDGGEYGKLLGGHFRRTISDPAWLDSYWDPAQVGGPMLDLHVHDAHLIRYLFGMPRSVSTYGRMRGECAQSWLSVFQYDDPELFVSAASGTIDQQGRPFLHGYEIQLEKATISFEFAVLGDEGGYISVPTLLDTDGNVSKPDLGDGDPLLAFAAEISVVINSIATGTPSPILSGDLAGDAITLCHAQTQSLKSGQPCHC